jgi:hypothetical protein
MYGDLFYFEHTKCYCEIASKGINAVIIKVCKASGLIPKQ